MVTGVTAQDNSPYSRYGIGDLSPNTNIFNRAMGGISAAYANPLSVNYLNPASYAAFIINKNIATGEVYSGRVVLDVGINLDSRTLRETNNPVKFTSPNTFFSYLNVGLPIKKNWGASFGLRPVSKVSYRVVRTELLTDPVNQTNIDTALTEFSGNGGSYLASFGTGFAIKKLRIGFNFGYLFGKKDYSSKRTIVNDTVTYARANYETAGSFGNIYWNGGLQYVIDLKNHATLTLGAYGNLEQKINAYQDRKIETFSRDANGQDLRIDSVYEENDVKGKIIYPSGFGAGILYEKQVDFEKKTGGWLVGADYSGAKWSNYRYYGVSDSVQDNWEIRVGGQIQPFPGRNYWSNVTYRGGFFVGEDYLKFDNKLPVYGFSLGVGLPMAFNRQVPGQVSNINLSFEYIKRGNNTNLIKENLFRFSLGFSLSDNWFGRRKYD